MHNVQPLTKEDRLSAALSEGRYVSPDLIMHYRYQHHPVDLLNDLHWLPVRGRVDYKIAVLCYKAVNYNNRRIFLLYSRHKDSRESRGHLRPTYCQHSLHR